MNVKQLDEAAALSDERHDLKLALERLADPSSNPELYIPPPTEDQEEDEEDPFTIIPIVSDSRPAVVAIVETRLAVVEAALRQFGIRID